MSHRRTQQARLSRVAALIPAWTLREIRAQYRQSAFDIGWSLLTPVITLAGFGFVLTRTFGVDGGGVPYIVFAWTGIVLWTFVANALLRGASSLVAVADLVRKVNFPKEVVPLATVLAAGLDLLIGLAVLAGLMALEGIGPSVTALAGPIVLVVLVLWASAGAILFAAITAFVRDLTHGLAVILRIGIFVTPVMYPPDEVPERYRWLLDVNPIAVFIDAFRSSLLYERWPDWSLLGAHVAGMLVLLTLALWYVQRVEGRIADVI